MTPGLWALLAAVAIALCLGLMWRARQGRIRVRNKSTPADVEESVFDQLPEGLRRHLTEAADGDARVTLLQLSTTFCAPCRHTRVLLAHFAERTEGVRHVEVDLTHHPEWATPLGVHTTPTTLAFDDSGRELFRVGGVPRRDELTRTLRSHLG
ncbi:TlpA family protein disulfide reductase [Haloactinomyces albus]|uniref:Thiol-disulfide isomerase/thioredoxin n=1 Tax=Haloactinomyces albus TaxID=1352928 RepID=A0AAE3ZEK7_9ACTN|nr:thioredoxin family protein [Haloactinomyces albus]MDR7302213.1 thiol-disulfide isomerase/thioredoxin [Haloactinomyces albus]